MKVSNSTRTRVAAALGVAALACNSASAGGISLYEVGTPDVGLAAAGYSARAQDAATVLTNPAGMVRLAGDQFMLGAQVLHADLRFSIEPGTSPALGTGDGGNPVGWFPGGGLFYTHSLSPDLKLGLAVTGNFGSAVKYDDGLGRPLPRAGGHPARRVGAAVDRDAHRREAVAGCEPERDVRQARQQGGGEQHHRRRWQPVPRGHDLGRRRQPGAALRSRPQARASASPTPRRSSSTSARSRSGAISRPAFRPCLRRAGCSMPGPTSASPCRRG